MVVPSEEYTNAYKITACVSYLSPMYTGLLGSYYFIQTNFVKYWKI